MAQFDFLRDEWPDLNDAAGQAEAYARPDARTACVYARRSLELVVHWLYKHDSSIQLPYQDSLSALIREPTFRAAVGSVVFAKAKLIKNLANLAVHSHKRIVESDALVAVRELFHVGYRLAHTYARGAKPSPGLTFDANALPTAALPKQTLE